MDQSTKTVSHFSWRKFSIYFLSAAFVLAGVNHFINEEFYLKIMPPWLPWHRELVMISGICEIVFGLMLLVPRWRRVASWCIIVLLIALFPANIQMAIDYWREDHPRLWLAVVRLPVQGVLVWWVEWMGRKSFNW